MTAELQQSRLGKNRRPGKSSATSIQLAIRKRIYIASVHVLGTRMVGSSKLMQGEEMGGLRSRKRRLLEC
ncbi:hypothetical protein L195_g032724 [Trifolium pratense]|uniref:Uncharacterized protein n=1 Tax=Trifolium pratense TaxID=57577 RepID=A0A2K3LE09_TRIPR|nr:hypothetical protein L195_g032724 [Trifolium pratense]